MLRHAILVTVAACGSAVLVTPASAQPATAVSDNGWHVGAVSLQPAVLVAAGVDTNILRQPNDGLRDVVGVLATGLGVHVGRETVQLDATGLVGYQYYRDYSNLRAADQAYSGRASLVGRKTKVYAGGAWLNVRERFNYELEARVRRTEDRIGAGAEVGFTPRTSLALDVERADTVFDDAAGTEATVLADVQQQRRERMALTTNYRLTPLTSLQLGGVSERTTFVQSPARDARRYQATFGATFLPAALVSGAFTFGYQWFEPTVTTLVPRAQGLVAKGDLSWRLHDRTSLQFGADRDIEYSYQVELPIYTLTALRLGLSQRIGDRWRLAGSVSGNRLDYASHAQPGANVDGQIDRGAGWRALCELRVTREVQIAVEGQYLRRRSVDAQRQFGASQFLVSIRYAPGRPRLAGGRP